ncbi:MAG: GntR family transcriptional regulator [Ktedonobacterales bacterium]
MPKYLQIVEQVKAMAADGVLAAGVALPAVRQLAGDLGINVNTVVAAYRVLEAEHVILLRRGARAIIHPRLARRDKPQPDAVPRVRTLLEHVRTDALLLGMDPVTLRSLAREIFGD